MLVILDNDLEILTIDDLSYTIVKGDGAQDRLNMDGEFHLVTG